MKNSAILGAFLGLASVITGAAGDHMLAGNLTEHTRHMFDTALRYHQLYAFLITCLALVGLQNISSRLYKGALYAFIAGTVLFCGSLYAAIALDMPKLTWLTPFGGLGLMAGWVLLALDFGMRRKG